ncbi:hypothetical protein HMPREF9131_0968, partial [Peptoniphilus sp. oral taxon 836 str. F0141]
MAQKHIIKSIVDIASLNPKLSPTVLVATLSVLIQNNNINIGDKATNQIKAVKT